MIIEADQAHLFIEEAKLNDALKQQFTQDNVVLHPYDAVYEYVKTIPAKHISLDKGCVNYRITASLPEECEVHNQKNPNSQIIALPISRTVLRLRISCIG